MCGRFSLAIAPEKLAELFKTINFLQFQERFNIAPTQPIIAVRQEDDGRTASWFRWGLVPFWAKDIQIGQKLTNARSETLAEKPSFRAAFRYRRCIVPASGFYEWKTEGKTKTPFYIFRRDQAPIAMAGLWEHWIDPGGSELVSATIVTTEANRFMTPLHHRMPVILDSSDWDTWLDPKLQKGKDLAYLLKPLPEEVLDAYPVSSLVNATRNESPECIRPRPRGKKPSSGMPLQGELF